MQKAGPLAVVACNIQFMHSNIGFFLDAWKAGGGGFPKIRLMCCRWASINDIPITKEERRIATD